MAKYGDEIRNALASQPKTCLIKIIDDNGGSELDVTSITKRSTTAAETDAGATGDVIVIHGDSS